jgi:hypothetical protein
MRRCRVKDCYMDYDEADDEALRQGGIILGCALGAAFLTGVGVTVAAGIISGAIGGG